VTRTPRSQPWQTGGSADKAWASMAAEHGYFDQSHLIRDFRGFTGMTPTGYLARRGPARHHARA